MAQFGRVWCNYTCASPFLNQPSTSPTGGHLAKPNYQFEKRQRDLAKKSKQEAKRQQKLADKAAGIVTEDAEPDAGSAAEIPDPNAGAKAKPPAAD